MVRENRAVAEQPALHLLACRRGRTSRTLVSAHRSNSRYLLVRFGFDATIIRRNAIFVILDLAVLGASRRFSSNEGWHQFDPNTYLGLPGIPPTVALNRVLPASASDMSQSGITTPRGS